MSPNHSYKNFNYTDPKNIWKIKTDINKLLENFEKRQKARQL